MAQPPYPQRPRRRGFIPFPIVLPGCCGCGGVFVTGLLVAGALTTMFGLGQPTPEAQPGGSETAVVQQVGE